MSTYEEDEAERKAQQEIDDRDFDTGQLVSINKKLDKIIDLLGNLKEG